MSSWMRSWSSGESGASELAVDPAAPIDDVDAVVCAVVDMAGIVLVTA